MTLSNDLNIITAEINSYKQVAGQAIFEIGRRLKWVKENDLVHGEWEQWLENNFKMSKSQAYKYIKVFKEFEEIKVLPTKPLDALYYISTLSEEERGKKHEIPSSGETKTVDEMTVRELREVKKALKEAEEDKNYVCDIMSRANKITHWIIQWAFLCLARIQLSLQLDNSVLHKAD